MGKRRAALLLAALVSAGCARVSKVNIFTVPQEMAVGEVFATEVEAYYPILGDPRVSWYLNHRGRSLAAVSDRPDLPYRFGAIDTPELNAFAIPGGHIYFNVGMVEAAESESELLGVVAHEIGHVVAQHSMKQLSTQSIVNILGTLVLNQYPNQWAALAANLFTPTTFLKMSRDAEREADAIGFQLMVRAGYDPQGMVELFGKLLLLRDKEPSLLEKLFLTHPPTQERIDNIKAMIASQQLPSNLIRDTEVFQETHRHIVDTYYTESYRRRWKEYLRQKDKARDEEGEEDADRLPWDKPDEKKRKDKKDKKEKPDKDEKPAPEPPGEGSKPSLTAAPDGAGELDLAAKAPSGLPAATRGGTYAPRG